MISRVIILSGDKRQKKRKTPTISEGVFRSSVCACEQRRENLVRLFYTVAVVPQFFAANFAASIAAGASIFEILAGVDQVAIAPAAVYVTRVIIHMLIANEAQSRGRSTLGAC